MFVYARKRYTCKLIILLLDVLMHVGIRFTRLFDQSTLTMPQGFSGPSVAQRLALRETTYELLTFGYVSAI